MHNRFDENWAEFGKFVFLAGAQAPGEAPASEKKEAEQKAPPEGQKPTPETKPQAERTEDVREAQTVGQIEQEISKRFANLLLYPEFKNAEGKTINIKDSFETSFKATLGTFNQSLDDWQKNHAKDLSKMISTSSRYAEAARKKGTDSKKTMDEITADVLQRIAAKIPEEKGALPSQVNVEHTTKEFMAVYDFKGLDEAAQKELAGIYRTYFTEMNKAIQEAKLNIKLSKLTDDERKIWYEYGDLNEQQITDRLKGKTPEERKKIMDQIASVDKKMKEFEGEAETVAQELKEGTFLATLMSLFQSIMEFLKRLAGQLGFNTEQGAEQEPEKIVQKNPLGDEKFVVTSWPGEREPPRTPDGKEGSKNHMGIDVSVENGSSLYAGVNGKAIETGSNEGHGKFIKIQLINGQILTYAHLSNIDVKKDDDVEPGIKIGLTGNTGVSTGPHLHIELADAEGNYLNPMPLFKKYAADGSVEKPEETAVAKFFEDQNKARQNAVAAAPAQTEPKKT